MFPALLFALVLVVDEFTQPVHFLVEGLEDGMGGEELVQPRELATDDEAAAWFNILPQEGQWENTFEWDRHARIVTFAD